MRAVAGAVVLVAGLALGLPAAAAAPSDVDRARARANAAAAALSNAETKLAVVQHDIETLEARRKDNVQRLATLRSGLRDVAVAQYMHGRVRTSLPADLDPSDASAAARARALESIVASGAVSALDAYRDAADDLQAQESQLAALRKSADAAASSLRKQQASVEAELNRIVALDAKEKAAAKAAAGSSPTVTRGGPKVIGSGNWICPVQGARAFSDDYGDPRSGGRRHEGNDILSPRGTPVVAPVAGSAQQHDNGLGGHAFYLHGADGITYYGAHLDSYSSNYGEVVAGTVLGYVGNTGDASGGPTHLHFEIHPGGGAPIDPYPTLRQYC